jgi:hypothetical protein
MEEDLRHRRNHDAIFSEDPLIAIRHKAVDERGTVPVLG